MHVLPNSKECREHAIKLFIYAHGTPNFQNLNIHGSANQWANSDGVYSGNSVIHADRDYFDNNKFYTFYTLKSLSSAFGYAIEKR
jgi:hypothetical protein